MMEIDLRTSRYWSKCPPMADWQANARLDPFTPRIRSMKATDTEAIAHLQRYAKYVGAAAAKLPGLLRA